MAEHRRRRATPSGGGIPLAPFGLRAAHTRLRCCGSSMMLGHYPPRRASYPHPRRLQHGLSVFCHGLPGVEFRVNEVASATELMLSLAGRTGALYR